MALGILDSLPQVGRVTHWTLFTPARTQLFMYGFFGMTMFGAMYEIVPRLHPDGWPSIQLRRRHFVLAAAGLAFYALPLLIGGVVQGLALNDPARPFVEVMRTSLMFFRVGTLGDLLMAAGNVLLALNLGWLLVRCCRAWCVARSAAARAEIAEVAR
jgi:cytochrome c oxidase cbb3-type subunit 1